MSIMFPIIRIVEGWHSFLVKTENYADMYQVLALGLVLCWALDVDHSTEFPQQHYERSLSSPIQQVQNTGQEMSGVRIWNQCYLTLATGLLVTMII